MAPHWVLEGIAIDGSRTRHVIRTLPFRIGRAPDNDLPIEAGHLSRYHAVFSQDASGALVLTDQNSTNGTYVNRERLTAPRTLTPNDVLHFGNAEFRVAQETMPVAAPAPEFNSTTKAPVGGMLSQNFVRAEREFLELLEGTGLAGAGQPIVHTVGHGLYGYELLGRCTHPGLPSSPLLLFNIAKALGKEVELSKAFRKYGIIELGRRVPGARLFVNTHPDETFADGFVEELVAMRAASNGAEIVVEIHEAAVVEVAKMRELAARLAAIGMRFAYDDFGAGQARINEIAEVPAHIVKFDMGLCRDISKATERKQQVVRDLVRMVRDLGSETLAEGVESAEDAALCQDMGFDLLQGYHTGRPRMITDFPAP